MAKRTPQPGVKRGDTTPEKASYLPREPIPEDRRQGDTVVSANPLTVPHIPNLSSGEMRAVNNRWLQPGQVARFTP